MTKLRHHFIAQKHPLGAKIIFSYGMTKCGSTLAFELARSALELSGFPQPLLPEQSLGLARKINFCQHLNTSNIKALEENIDSIGHPIVIKTHTRPDPCVIDLINRGGALVQATYRDPREMALSMRDQAIKNAAANRAAFCEITDLAQAKINIASQIDSLTQWLYRPNCLALYYSDLAFRQMRTTRRILAQLHLDIPPQKVIRHVLKHRFTQRNKAQKNRYRFEMSPQESNDFKNQFAGFYDTLIKHRHLLPEYGTPPLSQDVSFVKLAADTS